MSNDRELILRVVMRAIKGEDVSFDEIDGLRIRSNNEHEQSLVEEFWNELMIFINDFDIRSRDKEYATQRTERLQDVLAKLQSSGVLPLASAVSTGQ